MSTLDSILKNIGGAPDDVANLASSLGIDPGIAEKAIAVLGQTHQMDGDTVELASERTGLDTGILSQIVSQIGGEGSLGEFARMVQEDPSSLAGLLDFDGDGNPMDDIAGMAKGLFGGR